jgi:hypothetical protein
MDCVAAERHPLKALMKWASLQPLRFFSLGNRVAQEHVSAVIITHTAAKLFIFSSDSEMVNRVPLTTQKLF